MENSRIYAVRNTKTGKLVSDLGGKHKKYWDKKECALAAIQNSWQYKYESPDTLKIVEFVLVEVESEKNLKQSRHIILGRKEKQ